MKKLLLSAILVGFLTACSGGAAAVVEPQRHLIILKWI